MNRGQIGFEMLMVFAIAITLVIWSAKLVDSLNSGAVTEKIQVKIITELVNSACSTKAKFTDKIPCSFENGQSKSYSIQTQGNTLSVLTGEKTATATTLCPTEGDLITINCNEPKICFTPLDASVRISSGECVN